MTKINTEQISNPAFNGGELYFKTMHQIAPLVNEYVQDLIQTCGVTNPSLMDTLLILPKKRVGRPVMRPNLTYLVYRAMGGEKTVNEIIPALAVSELSNYHLYLDNWIYDNKAGVGQDRHKLNLITAAGEVLRSLTQKAIEQIPASALTQRDISNSLLEATISCCDGQTLDFETNTSFVESLNDESFMEMYQNRAHNLSGKLYGVSTEIGAKLALEKTPDSTGVKTARQFGELLGTGLHISGDLGDFALNCADQTLKHYQDQLADIINNRLTLPIYHTLKHGTQLQREFLSSLIGKKNASFEEKFLGAKSIIAGGGFDATIRLLNQYVLLIKREAKNFPDNDWRDALSSAAISVRQNHYIRQLRDLTNKVLDI